MSETETEQWGVKVSEKMPGTYPHATKWLVRRERDGKGLGRWMRLYRTPRGGLYLLDRAHQNKRVPYTGPTPEE